MAPFIFWAALRRFVGGSSRLCPRRCAGVCRGVPAVSRFALVSGFLPAAWPVSRRRMLSSEPPDGPRGDSICLDGRTRLRARPGMVLASGYRASGCAGSSSPFSAFRWHSSQIIRVLPFMTARLRLHRCRLQISQGNIPFFSAVSQAWMTAAGRRLPLPGFRRLRGGAGGSRAARRRPLPPLFLVQKILQDSGPAGMAQLPDGLRLDLPDSFPRHPEHAAYFLQRLRPAVGQPEP